VTVVVVIILDFVVALLLGGTIDTSESILNIWGFIPRSIQSCSFVSIDEADIFAFGGMLGAAVVFLQQSLSAGA